MQVAQKAISLPCLQRPKKNRANQVRFAWISGMFYQQAYVSVTAMHCAHMRMHTLTCAQQKAKEKKQLPSICLFRFACKQI